MCLLVGGWVVLGGAWECLGGDKGPALPCPTAPDLDPLSRWLTPTMPWASHKWGSIQPEGAASLGQWQPCCYFSKGVASFPDLSVMGRERLPLP